MRTQVETELTEAVEALLAAKMEGWPEAERGRVQRALLAYQKEPTQLQRVLVLLKLPPGGHMGDVEGAISRLLDLETAVVKACSILRRAGYKDFSIVEGARWAAQQIAALGPPKAPSRGRVDRVPQQKTAAKRRAR